MQQTHYLRAFWLCAALFTVAQLGRTSVYTYWQVTLMPDGRQVGPTMLTTEVRELPPSAQNPISVTPRVVEGAKEYHLVRLPRTMPAAPTVQVVNAGHDTLYYWLVGHAGLYRSPIAGPAVAAKCDAAHPNNIVNWVKTPPYGSFTILRTNSPQVPSGLLNVMLAWGSTGVTFTDTFEGVLADYPCYPDGTSEFTPPIGSGPFLAGISHGEAIHDTGDLQLANVAPLQTRTETDGQITEHNAGREGALALNIENNRPDPTYGWGGPVGLYIDETDTAGGHNDYWMGNGGPHAKSTHVPFWIWQHNYTAGQVATMLLYSEKHGKGDNVALNLHNSTDGLIEDGGDEGTEIFMSSASRFLTAPTYRLAADAPARSALLACDSNVTRTGTGRVVVNLSQAQHEGAITHIDDDMKINPQLGDRYAENRVTRVSGDGTHWQPEMLGWYISLDCDTRADGIRQWYRVIKVNSPTSMDIYAYTFFSSSTYLGHAANVDYHGFAYRGGHYKYEPRLSPDPKRAASGRDSYLLAPATTVADQGLIDGKLFVMPLKQLWKKGDNIQVIAGPQTNLMLGKMGLEGSLLPQDFAGGLWLYDWTDRLSNDGALWIQGAWNMGIQISLDGQGLSSGVVIDGKANPAGAAVVLPADTNGLRFDKVPVVLSGLQKTGEMLFSEGKADGRKVLGIAPGEVTLGAGVALKGSDQLRGRALFSGDGKKTTFTLNFPRPYAEPPYVVVSSNLPLGLGVSAVKTDSATLVFASPPPTGNNNITFTWIVIE